ncbi:type II toxin-antitoxin system RelE/ParE family toxin [Vandammella animalimorsus]|uniref:type II toxin-antitoxin system RelE/ParE family toxin n=1 Tax=Vandammella animalimorsus TaxID=2029117 RepID=UPI00268734A5
MEHYLREQAVPAALGLIDALEQAYAQIARHPTTGSPRYAHELDLPGLRSWPLKRYPYLVFYVARSDHIDVWRVRHERRDMPAWLHPDAPSASDSDPQG